MIEQPSFWIVAGINGAGKSSTAAKIGMYGNVFNPDLTAKEFQKISSSTLDAANLEAVIHIESFVAAAIEKRESVSVETVLSTQKYLPHVKRAKELGFNIGMAYFALDNVELSIKRVSERVLGGGHNVPEDKIRSRWNRSLDNLGVFSSFVDELHVFDNSRDEPFLVAYKENGNIIMVDPDRLPHITKRLI